MLREMSVVVTGASGFLGKRVVEALLIRSVNVYPVARTLEAGIFHVENYDQAPLADVLIHLAEDPNRARVNAAGTEYEKEVLRTLAVLLNKGYKTVVYASSALLYGDRCVARHGVNDPVEVVDTYTNVKRQAELAVLRHERGVVVRLANLYGPGMSGTNVVSKILGQLDSASPMQVWDDSPIRDVLWVDDAAAGIVNIALHAEKSGIFNLGSGEGTSIAALAQLAMKLSGQESRTLEATNPGNGSSVLVLDIDQTTRIWGWQPRVTLHEGLSKLIENGSHV